MKKIKILHGFLAVLLIAFVFGTIGSYQIISDFEGQLYQDMMITFVFSILIVLALLYAQRALYAIIKKGFFTNVASKRFKLSGLFFILAGIGNAAFTVIKLGRESAGNNELLMLSFIQDFLMIMIGLGLFILAEFVQNGNLLKQENDLTI